MGNTNEDFDFSYLKSISQGDENFIIEMVKTFNEQAPLYITNVTRFYKENNLIGVSKEAHKLVPGVGFMGMKSLEADLMHLEEYTKKNYNLDQVKGLINASIEKITRIMDGFKKEYNLS